jgi:hypothetical protein
MGRLFVPSVVQQLAETLLFRSSSRLRFREIITTGRATAGSAQLVQ